MTSDAPALALDTFRAMLSNLAHCLELGRAHALELELPVDGWVSKRLAPDMYTLAQQVLLACFHAEDASSRLAGVAPPAMGEPDQCLDALLARIRATQARLDALAPSACTELAGERAIELTLDAERAFYLTGAQLVRDWALPHFYFHVVTAYDILRHHGVALGKPDYLGHVGRYIRPRAARGIG